MKREELETLGLSKEQIDTIMTRNGQDIENAKQNAIAAEKLRADGLQAQLDTLTADLNTARNEAITAKDFKAKLEAADAKIKAFEKSSAVRSVVSKHNPRDIDLVLKLLDDSKIVRAEDGTITGVEEQMTALRESNGYLFTDTPDPRGGNPNPGNAGGNIDMNAFLRG